MTDSASDIPAIAMEPVAQSQATVRDEPVALSFPTILRNPKFAHLNVHSVNERQAANESPLPKKKDSRDKDGKRRIRRLENSEWYH